MNAELDNMQVIAGQYNKTVADTALSLEDLGFTEDQVKQARAAYVTVETYPIRYNYGMPTSSAGHLVNAGDGGWIQGRKALQSLKMIRATGSSATVQVTLYK